MVGYRFLADVVVVVHLAYALTIVIGLLLILLGAWRKWRWVRNFWFRAVHLLMIAVVAMEAVCGLPCPLTEWEAQLRRLGGETVYPGSFIGNLANEVLFFEAPEWVFDVAHVVFFLLVVTTFVVAPPRWPARWTTRRQAARSE